jgi:WD40 repeat protein
MHTIHYFCELATKNLEGVTCDTLTIIQDPLQDQPIATLNKLPHPIKRYVMRKAYEQVRFVYNIVFKGHTDTIESVDTNTRANLAASASKDKTFCLWKLSNGELLHIFDTIPAHHGYVKFNADGSQLATATVYKENPNKTKIFIWDTKSKQLLYQMKQKSPITNLNFFPDDGNILLAIGKNNHLLLYKLKKNSPAIHVGSITQGIKTKTERIQYAREGDNYCWMVSKNARPLGVCEYALHNTKSEKSLMTITQIPLYKKLTEHEQDILQAKLAQRIESLEPTKTLYTLRILLG